MNVRCFPGCESGQGAGMTVLSTLCSWDVSPMICGHSLFPVSPASWPASSRAACPFIMEKPHFSRQSQPYMLHWRSWSRFSLHTFYWFSSVPFTWTVLSSTSMKPFHVPTAESSPQPQNPTG